MWSLDTLMHIILPTALWPWGRLASNRNEYQESSWGIRGGRPAHKADNLAAICKPINYKMWEPRRLTNLWASTACYRDSFIFLLVCTYPVNPFFTSYLFLVTWGEVRLSPLGTSVTISPIVPASDDDECQAVGGMRIGRGNRITCRKPASVPLCPPQILLDLTWYLTWAAEVGIRRPTAWSMARRHIVSCCFCGDISLTRLCWNSSYSQNLPQLYLW
jgi:hypothetical protein